jgi:hypothetical protein
MRLFGIMAALLAVVGLAVAAGAGAFGASRSPPRGAAPLPTPAELQKLGQLALRVATLDDVSVPAGAKAPTRTVLTLTFDSRANESLDLGAGTRMPNLYAMGQPEPLPLPFSS